VEVKLHPGDTFPAHPFKVITFTLINKRAGLFHEPLSFWAPVPILKGFIAAVSGELPSFLITVSDLVV